MGNRLVRHTERRRRIILSAITVAESVRLDPARPLHIAHIMDGPTIAIVSAAWLRNQCAGRISEITLRHLSAAEAEYFAALPVPARRTEWLAGRLAAKHAVRAYRRLRLGAVQPTRDIVVSAASEQPYAGRPLVDSPVQIGISHSGDFAVAGCAAGPLGIDLERNRRLAPVLVAALRAPERGAMRPPLQWACREAVLKYFGVGLRVDPREIELIGWQSDGSFTWSAGPGLRDDPVWAAATAIRWPRRAWAGEFRGYSFALVW